MLRTARQNARMSKITNDGLTRSGTECCIVVPIWQRWTSKGKLSIRPNIPSLGIGLGLGAEIGVEVPSSTCSQLSVTESSTVA